MKLWKEDNFWLLKNRPAPRKQPFSSNPGNIYTSPKRKNRSAQEPQTERQIRGQVALF